MLDSFVKILIKKSSKDLREEISQTGSSLVEPIVEALIKNKNKNMRRKKESAPLVMQKTAHSLDPVKVVMLRDAIGFHISHYQAAMKKAAIAAQNGNEDQASYYKNAGYSHMRRGLNYVKKVDVLSTLVGDDVLRVDKVPVQPWTYKKGNASSRALKSAQKELQAMVDTPPQDLPQIAIDKKIKDLEQKVANEEIKLNLHANKGLNDLPKNIDGLSRFEKNLGSQQLNKEPGYNVSMHSKSIANGHDGGYPFENIRIKSSFDDMLGINDGGYIHIDHDLEYPDRISHTKMDKKNKLPVLHEMDSHPMKQVDKHYGQKGYVTRGNRSAKTAVNYLKNQEDPDKAFSDYNSQISNDLHTWNSGGDDSAKAKFMQRIGQTPGFLDRGSEKSKHIKYDGYDIGSSSAGTFTGIERGPIKQATGAITADIDAAGAADAIAKLPNPATEADLELAENQHLKNLNKPVTDAVQPKTQPEPSQEDVSFNFDEADFDF